MQTWLVLTIIGIVCLAVIFGLPFVVYLSVKLGTYAFYRGRGLHQKEEQDGKDATTKS